MHPFVRCMKITLMHRSTLQWKNLKYFRIKLHRNFKVRLTADPRGKTSMGYRMASCANFRSMSRIHLNVVIFDFLPKGQWWHEQYTWPHASVVATGQLSTCFMRFWQNMSRYVNDYRCSPSCTGMITNKKPGKQCENCKFIKLSGSTEISYSLVRIHKCYRNLICIKISEVQ